MANKKYEETDVQAIATAIREKTGTETTYKVSDMASGVNEVYDTGIVKMWNCITNNQTRDSAERVFNEGDFTDIEDLPVWSPVGYAARAFYNYNGEKLPRPKYVDLSKLSATSTETVSQTFAWWKNTNTTTGIVPDYGIQAPVRYFGTFQNSTGIRVITKIRTKAETIFMNTFDGSPNITDITFEGVIGQNISVGICTKLSHATLMNIIECLKDYSTDESGTVYTVLLGSTNIAKLTAEELQIIIDKGWDYK